MTPDALEHRLHPQVAAYTAGNYSLLSDLTHLQGVRSVGATEATIFYSARILEVLAADAIARAGLAPSASSFSNLETLVEFNLIGTTTLYWANALRRLGNDVRHVLRGANPDDADLAALFAERWMKWFFCQYRFGPRLPALAGDGLPLILIRDPAVSELVAAIDAEDFDPTAWLGRQVSGGEPPFMRCSTLAAVIANHLLDRGETTAAFAVLDPARQRFGDDLRLQQLDVLAWKRRGDLDKALENIAPLLARSRDDDETAGIVAGVYKRVYLDRDHDLEMLGKSHRAYRAGWEGSKSSNAYLGINAAATALWLNRPVESRRLAGDVHQLLRKRMAALRHGGDEQMIAASYWDQVTLAESELLLGGLAAARDGYRRAFSDAAKSKGNLQVAQEQAERHLPHLGLTLSGQDFFHLSSPPPGTKLVIGITGHRHLGDESALLPPMIQAIERIAARAPGPAHLVLLTALAAGADCLAAEVVAGKFNGRLRAVLPLEVAEYCKDFTANQRQRFHSLLNICDAIVYPPPLVPRRQAPDPPPAHEQRLSAYELAGVYVCDHCDILLAVWDGLPARGRGGTADIVAYARKTQRPLAWLDSKPPYALTIPD